MHFSTFLTHFQIKPSLVASKFRITTSHVSWLKLEKGPPSLALARAIETETKGLVPVSSWRVNHETDPSIDLFGGIDPVSSGVQCD